VADEAGRWPPGAVVQPLAMKVFAHEGMVVIYMARPAQWFGLNVPETERLIRLLEASVVELKRQVGG
jgi:hypothetical protein